MVLATNLGGPVKMEGMTIDDVKVDVFGSTAVVRGRMVATATINDARTTSRLRFIDVFLKRQATWQAVASQSTPLP